MNLRRILGIVILTAGIVLLAVGIRSTRQFDEQVVKEVKGRYTQNTMVCLIAGAALIVIGGLTLRERRR
jgi:uncharacterized membrane protein YidH (DUF202 family)